MARSVVSSRKITVCGTRNDASAPVSACQGTVSPTSSTAPSVRNDLTGRSSARPAPQKTAGAASSSEKTAAASAAPSTRRRQRPSQNISAASSSASWQPRNGSPAASAVRSTQQKSSAKSPCGDHLSARAPLRRSAASACITRKKDRDKNASRSRVGRYASSLQAQAGSSMKTASFSTPRTARHNPYAAAAASLRA